MTFPIMRRWFFSKTIDNEKLVKVINGLNQKFNTTIKNLSETKKNVSALRNQLTIEEEKKKALELERNNLLEEKKLAKEETSTLWNQLASFEKEKKKKSDGHTL